MANGEKQLQSLRGRKLKAGETVLAWIVGLPEDGVLEGILAATSERLIFYRKGITGEKFEAIALDKISSIETSSRLGSHKILAYTSNDKMEFKTYFNKLQFDDFIKKLETARGPSQAAKVNGSSASSSLDDLKKLGELRDAGILSAAEFDAKKAELLARL